METRENALAHWFEELRLGAPATPQAISGGCINDTYLVETDAGARFFLKHHDNPPPKFFAAEAIGLDALREVGGFQVPEVIAYREYDLLLEYVPPEIRKPHAWSQAGRNLALQHQCIHHRFGFSVDTYCGLNRQPNQPSDDGHHFFARQRLDYQAHLANAARLLNNRDKAQLERIYDRLPQLVPQQPASLLHGDLWSGNLYFSRGAPTLIDPACYWGWPEADLGMTRLFGGFPASFYAAYQEIRPLEPEWEERLDLYNLYHLLNHLNLFGEGYLSQVRQVLARFGN